MKIEMVSEAANILVPHCVRTRPHGLRTGTPDGQYVPIMRFHYEFTHGRPSESVAARGV